MFNYKVWVLWSICESRGEFIGRYFLHLNYLCKFTWIYLYIYGSCINIRLEKILSSPFCWCDVAWWRMIWGLSVIEASFEANNLLMIEITYCSLCVCNLSFSPQPLMEIQSSFMLRSLMRNTTKRVERGNQVWTKKHTETTSFTN